VKPAAVDLGRTATQAMIALSEIARQDPEVDERMGHMAMGIAYLFGYISIGVEEQLAIWSLSDIVDRGLEALGISIEEEIE